ncbi:hypothetical protein JCM18909_4109 [Cutibacterium acnes JCM 18909]|nr:hypothetical protein JCM18909_4109 [Cutibacterium acnes JCM 18909]
MIRQLRGRGAARFGSYPTVSTAAMTLALVSGRTSGLSLSARGDGLSRRRRMLWRRR